MIFVGSRYENEPIVNTSWRNGTTRQVVFRPGWRNATTSVRYHLWTEVDRIDRLADRYLGSADRWWEILDANPDVLDPLSIRPGHVLRIPDGR